MKKTFFERMTKPWNGLFLIGILLLTAGFAELLINAIFFKIPLTAIDTTSLGMSFI
jgi:hypothetical protein